MFWDKGYMPSQNIEALLEKENSTVEEFLDDEDILQECKTFKKGIVNYFTRSEVITRLVEIITTEPSEELPMAQRYRHANMACEILTIGIPSLDEIFLLNSRTLTQLYSYLQNEPPLNPLLASFFSKTFSMLFTKKDAQDWFLHQQLCLQFLEYIKYQKNFLDLICKHFATPIIPDLVMQMMKKFEGGELKRNLYEWLTEEKLVERLIAILGDPQQTDTHANVAEFFCDLIQQGRTMRQTETENDSFEPAFEGSNPILKTIESDCTVEALLNVILEPNAIESAIVSGISVVLTLLKPVVFVDEPNADRWKFIQDREKEIHEKILTSVISVIAPRLTDFNELLKNPPNKPDIVTSAAVLSPPFGMTRLQICRVFTVLLQTKNEQVVKVICEIDFFETLLGLFKQYCWNNFLHTEVEKCLQLIFYTQLSNNNNSTQGSTIVNDGSFGKGSNNGDNNSSFFDFMFKASGNNGNGEGDGGGEGSNMDATTTNAAIETISDASVEDGVEEQNAEKPTALEEETVEEAKTNDNNDANGENSSSVIAAAKTTSDMEIDDKPKEDATAILPSDGENAENDNTKAPVDQGPTALQTHVIVNCKLVSKLIDCWQYNKEMESAARGRRLGFMGHLIKILKHITNCISESEHIGALIERNFGDATESQLWQTMINPTDGDFTKALNTQTKMLANCNAHEASEFVTDASTWDFMLALCDSKFQDDIVFALENDMLNNDDNGDTDLNLFQFGHIDGDDDEDEDNAAAAGDGLSLFGKSAASTSALQVFGATNNAWDNMDPFSDMTANYTATPWAADFNSDNFADFDAHFSSFANDLGASLNAAANSSPDEEEQQQSANNDGHTIENAVTLNEQSSALEGEEYDNNANVEKTAPIKSAIFGSFEGDENAKNERVATSIVRSLHSVMDDSEDDYEDDEGMWTKPLGGGSVDGGGGGGGGGNTDDDIDDVGRVTSQTIIGNGPLSKSAATLENDLHADLHKNELDGHNSVTNNVEHPAAEQVAKILNDAAAGAVNATTGGSNAIDEKVVTSSSPAATTTTT